jgi:hypothetical protein
VGLETRGRSKKKRNSSNDEYKKEKEKKMNRKHSIISKIRAKAKSVDPAIQLEGDLNHVYVSEYAGSPNGALSGKFWEICWDSVNSDVYINTDGSTAWVKVID